MVARARILVVEDEPRLGEILRLYLEREGHQVTVVTDGRAAIAAVDAEPVDLVVLDLMLPGLPGETVLTAIRERGETPVLITSTKRSDAERISGLRMGADDYLAKPFATDELLARVRALLRRGKPVEETLAIGDLRLDTVTREARRRDEHLSLTGRESALLELLMRNARRVVTRDQAIAEIWGGAATANAVDRHVSNLRRKLGEPTMIETVRGVGFLLQ